MMKTMKLGASKLQVPVIGLGCMRLTELEDAQAEAYLKSCLDKGINFFDHADIYGGGECEEKFARVLPMNDDLREKVFIQSKCSIVPGVMYDCSKEHIISSAEGILRRLNTDYLDLLLIHRPDALVEPEEVAEAFDELQSSGKVRHFGVSNHRPMQIELLKKHVRQELAVNQLQFSIPYSGMVSAGMEVNMTSAGAVDRDGSVLDYSRLHDMTIQAWSPFQMADWQGTFIGSERYEELNRVMAELGEKYGLGLTGIATAWILRHPAGIQMIAGTMNSARLDDIAAAADVELTREEWYRLYLAAGHILP